MTENLKSEDVRYIQTEIKKYWGNGSLPEKNYSDRFVSNTINEAGYLKYLVSQKSIQAHRLKLGLKGNKGRKPKGFSVSSSVSSSKVRVVKVEDSVKVKDEVISSTEVTIPKNHSILGFHKAEESGKFFLLTSLGVLEIKNSVL